MPRLFDNDKQLLEMAAIAMNRQADAALDNYDGWDLDGVPDRWAYAMLAVASWIQCESETYKARTRPYAVAAASAWFRDVEAAMPSDTEGAGDA